MVNRIPRRWIVAPAITDAAAKALAEYHPVVAQILFNRGHAEADEARAFLSGEYNLSDDPFQIAGMEAAVERLRFAIRNGERVAVYGDYDTDGVTATALLVTALESLGVQVQAYIPNRFDEGYGLNVEALTSLKEQGAGLVITVDCGVRSLREAEHAKQIGLDLIVSDHHHVGDELPEAVAVINPRQIGDGYPEKGLAGVGLAFKIAQALGKTETALRPEALLDLVALGTVADMAPLSGENRVLVRQGLRGLNETARRGVQSLLAVAGAKTGEVTAYTIGFMLGPRLNAAGRLDNALAAYELLVTGDAQRATELALGLEQQNRARQKMTLDVSRHAQELATKGDPPFLFAAHEAFPEGVVGLAAARLSELYYRPAAVAGIGPEMTRGSARSIKEFHITQALDSLEGLLERHGGHAAAAGFTVRNENRAALAEGLRAQAAAAFADHRPVPSLTVDAVVGSLSEVGPVLVRSLEMFEPTGYGNPRPVLAAMNLRLMSMRRVGSDGSHLKLKVSDGNMTMDCIGFRLADRVGTLPHRIDVAFTPEMNEWNGERRVQLVLRDARPAEAW